LSKHPTIRTVTSVSGRAQPASAVLLAVGLALFVSACESDLAGAGLELAAA